MNECHNKAYGSFSKKPVFGWWSYSREILTSRYFYNRKWSVVWQKLLASDTALAFSNDCCSIGVLSFELLFLYSLISTVILKSGSIYNFFSNVHNKTRSDQIWFLDLWRESLFTFNHYQSIKHGLHHFYVHSRETIIRFNNLCLVRVTSSTISRLHNRKLFFRVQKTSQSK